MSATELRSLVDELMDAFKVFDRLRYDEERPHKLGEPASEAEVRSLESRFGRPLPETYRDFLLLHNGWENFEATGKILGTNDHNASWVRDKIQFWNEIWTSDEQNPFQNGAIPVMFSKDLSYFVVLDPEKLDDAETDPFVEFDDMYESRAFPDFGAYLNAKLQSLRRLIERERNGTTAPKKGPGV